MLFFCVGLCWFVLVCVGLFWFVCGFYWVELGDGGVFNIIDMNNLQKLWSADNVASSINHSGSCDGAKVLYPECFCTLEMVLK